MKQLDDDVASVEEGILTTKQECFIPSTPVANPFKKEEVMENFPDHEVDENHRDGMIQ